MELLNNILALIAKPEVVAVSAIVVESVLRLVKTDKPAGIVHSLSNILKLVGNAAGGVASFLDKVLPQNVAPKA